MTRLQARKARQTIVGAILFTVSGFAMVAMLSGAAYCDFDNRANLDPSSHSPCLEAIYRELVR